MNFLRLHVPERSTDCSRVVTYALLAEFGNLSMTLDPFLDFFPFLHLADDFFNFLPPKKILLGRPIRF